MSLIHSCCLWLHGDAGEGYGVKLGALAVDEAKVAVHSDHRSIVGGVGEFRDEDLPAIATSVVVEGITQTRIGRYATSYSDLADS